MILQRNLALLCTPTLTYTNARIHTYMHMNGPYCSHIWSPSFFFWCMSSIARYSMGHVPDRETGRQNKSDMSTNSFSPHFFGQAVKVLPYVDQIQQRKRTAMGSPVSQWFGATSTIVRLLRPKVGGYIGTTLDYFFSGDNFPFGRCVLTKKENFLSFHPGFRSNLTTTTTAMTMTTTIMSVSDASHSLDKNNHLSILL